MVPPGGQIDIGAYAHGGESLSFFRGPFKLRIRIYGPGGGSARWEKFPILLKDIMLEDLSQAERYKKFYGFKWNVPVAELSGEYRYCAGAEWASGQWGQYTIISNEVCDDFEVLPGSLAIPGSHVDILSIGGVDDVHQGDDETLTAQVSCSLGNCRDCLWNFKIRGPIEGDSWSQAPSTWVNWYRPLPDPCTSADFSAPWHVPEDMPPGKYRCEVWIYQNTNYQGVQLDKLANNIEWVEFDIGRAPIPSMVSGGARGAVHDFHIDAGSDCVDPASGKGTYPVIWEVKAKGSGEGEAGWEDYSGDCVEEGTSDFDPVEDGVYTVTLWEGQHIDLTCSYEGFPDYFKGPHDLRISWCDGRYKYEGKYGYLADLKGLSVEGNRKVGQTVSFRAPVDYEGVPSGYSGQLRFYLKGPLQAGADWASLSPVALDSKSFTSSGDLTASWVPEHAGEYMVIAQIVCEGSLVDTESLAFTIEQDPERLSDDCRFVNQDIPAQMTPGSKHAVELAMENTGESTWTSALGYKLGSQNPQDNSVWGLSRVGLDGADSVAPGSTKTFNFEVTAPADPGTYNIQWRMLREGKQWFGETSRNIAVTVCFDRGHECTGDSECCSGHCREDYSGSVKYCAGESECVHAGVSYASSQKAPDCCDAGNERVCNSGSWSCTSCGGGGCSGECGSTVNGCVWAGSVCEGGSCGSSESDLDSSESSCVACAGEGSWVSSGDQTHCCGDDSGEFVKSRECVSVCTSDPLDVACCGAVTDCVFEGDPFSSGACREGLKCESGSWIDHCSNGMQDCSETGVDCGGSCGTCGLPVKSVCTYDEECSSELCREDYSGSVKYCAGESECVHAGDLYASSQRAPDCCDGVSERVCNDGVWDCVSCGEGSCSGECGSLNGCVWVGPVCQDGSCTSSEADLDSSESSCVACAGEGSWVSAGDQAHCCGDDPGELRVEPVYAGLVGDNNPWVDGFSLKDPDDSDIASHVSLGCCDSFLRCVWDGECYGAGASIDTGLDNNNRVFCYGVNKVAGVWLDCDGSEAYHCGRVKDTCGFGADADQVSGESVAHGGYSTGRGDGLECCGDDSLEYVRTRGCDESCTSDDTDSACCDAVNDCVYSGNCYPDGEVFERLKCMDGSWVRHEWITVKEVSIYSGRLEKDIVVDLSTGVKFAAVTEESLDGFFEARFSLVAVDGSGGSFEGVVATTNTDGAGLGYPTGTSDKTVSVGFGRWDPDCPPWGEYFVEVAFYNPDGVQVSDVKRAEQTLRIETPPMIEELRPLPDDQALLGESYTIGAKLSGFRGGYVVFYLQGPLPEGKVWEGFQEKEILKELAFGDVEYLPLGAPESGVEEVPEGGFSGWKDVTLEVSPDRELGEYRYRVIASEYLAEGKGRSEHKDIYFEIKNPGSQTDCQDGTFYTEFKTSWGLEDPLMSSCCPFGSSCVYSHICYSDKELADVDSDGVAGEFCDKGVWRDCDEEVFGDLGDGYVCTQVCHLQYVEGGEDETFGGYDPSGRGIGCCGDDAGEQVITSSEGDSVRSACCAEGHDGLIARGDGGESLVCYSPEENPEPVAVLDILMIDPEDVTKCVPWPEGEAHEFFTGDPVCIDASKSTGSDLDYVYGWGGWQTGALKDPMHIALLTKAETVEFKVTVTDYLGRTSEDTETIEVKEKEEPREKPVAVLKVGRVDPENPESCLADSLDETLTIATGEPFCLDASESTGEISTYTFTIGDSSGEASSAEGSAPVYITSLAALGDYRASVKLSNDYGDESEAYVDVFVRDRVSADLKVGSVDPEDAGRCLPDTLADVNEFDTDSPVCFDASGSGGSVDKYELLNADGSVLYEGESPVYVGSFAEVNEYEITLRVTGEAGDQDEYSVRVIVGEELAAVLKVGEFDPEDETRCVPGTSVDNPVVDNNQVICLDASESVGDIKKYEFIYPNGESREQDTPYKMVEATIPGLWSMTLRVTDKRDRTDEVTIDIEVLEPVFSASLKVGLPDPEDSSRCLTESLEDSITVAPGETVCFDASSSSGDVTSYEFFFPDNAGSFFESDEPVVTKAFESEGLRSIVLRTRGEDGKVSSASVEVDVRVGVLPVLRVGRVDPNDDSRCLPTTLGDSVTIPAGSEACFDASKSRGDITEYKFMETNSGFFYSGESPYAIKTFEDIGDYVVSLGVVSEPAVTSFPRVQVKVIDPKESSCETLGGFCGCAEGLVCEEPIEGSSDCGDSCCIRCAYPEYCEAQSETPEQDYISKVELNGAEKASSYTTYSDYTDPVFASVSSGGTYTLYVTVDADKNYGEYVAAWIDYDNDKAFTNDERIDFGLYVFPVRGGSHTFSSVFNVPPHSRGNVRMRVIVRKGEEPSACGTFPYGEVEDYTLEIRSPESGAEIIQASPDKMPWSGYYWPTLDSNIGWSSCGYEEMYNLYSDDGPLEHYDKYVNSVSVNSETDPDMTTSEEWLEDVHYYSDDEFVDYETPNPYGPGYVNEWVYTKEDMRMILPHFDWVDIKIGEKLLIYDQDDNLLYDLGSGSSVKDAYGHTISNSGVWDRRVRFNDLTLSYIAGESIKIRFEGAPSTSTPKTYSGVTIDNLGYVKYVEIGSEHPYAEDFENAWSVSEPSAARLRVHFERIALGSGDILEISDESGNVVETYRGDNPRSEVNDVWSIWIDGAAFGVRLKSDSEGSSYGFQIDRVEYVKSIDYSALQPFGDGSGDSLWHLEESGASKVRVRFANYNLEGGRDSVEVLDTSGNVVKDYGEGEGELDESNVWSPWIDGEALEVRLTTRSFSGARADSIGCIKPAAVESAHPYVEDYGNTWSVTEPSALRLRVHFERMDLGAVDTLKVSDRGDKIIATYTGDGSESALSDFWSPWIEGDVLNVRLESDSEGSSWGFRVDKVEYVKSVEYRQDLPFGDGEDPVEWLVEEPGATEVRLHFTGINITGKRDNVKILDGSDNLIVEYGKDDGETAQYNFWSPWVNGDKLKASLSTAKWGFRIDWFKHHKYYDYESHHPYAENYENTWVITHPFAEKIRAFFPRVQIEGNKDRLEILDGSDNVVETIGAVDKVYEAAGWSEWVDGNTLKIRLTTDGANNYYGFRANYIEIGYGSTYKSKVWEYVNDRKTECGAGWFGHCHGWSAASIAEPEPKEVRTFNGVEFSLVDQKGYLTDLNCNHKSEFIGLDRDNAKKFHDFLVENLKEKGQGIVIDVYQDRLRCDPNEEKDPDEEDYGDCTTAARDESQKWNHPVYKYYMRWTRNGDRVDYVTSLWYKTDGWSPSGSTGDGAVTYAYYIKDDGTSKFTTRGDSNAYTNNRRNKGYPDYAWIPTQRMNEQLNPHLNYDNVKKILSGEGIATETGEGDPGAGGGESG